MIIRNKGASVETWKLSVSPGAALVWWEYPSMNGMALYRFEAMPTLSSARYSGTGLAQERRLFPGADIRWIERFTKEFRA